MRWRRTWSLVLTLLACSSLTACSAPSRHPGILRLPLYMPDRALDPALASNPVQIQLASMLYSGLMKFSPDLHVIPELAVSIPTISDNGRVYTFTIRHDARFADGHPCRARDVAYSIARALHIGAPVDRRYLGDIKGAAAVESGRRDTLSGVRILGPLTLEIRLRHPDADFLQKLAFPPSWVVDRRVVSFKPLRNWPLRPTGTGPWTVRTRAADGTLTLTPRRHFYGGPLQLHSLILVPVSDESGALALYRKSAVDVAQLQADAVATYAGKGDFHQSAGLDTYYAELQGEDALSLDVRLNRSRLLRGLEPLLSPLNAIVPPAVPDYVPSGATRSAGDPQSQAPVHVLMPKASDPTVRRLGNNLARQWNQGSARGGPSVSARLFHSSFTLPSPDVWLRLVLPRTDSPWYRYELSTAGRLTNDPVTRMAIYQTCERWALNRGLLVPLASGTVSYLIKPSVQGLQVTPLGIMPDNDDWQSVQVT